MGEGARRRSADAPARHRRRKAAQGATVAAAVAAKEQHRRLAVGRRELKPAGRGLVGGLHLRDDAGERAVAQAIFGKRQYFRILAALRIEDLVGAKADLLKARRIKIKARHSPKDSEPRLDGEPRRDPGGKQGSAGIVGEARRRGGDLVQPRAIYAMIGQTLVHFGQPEGQSRPARTTGVGHAFAKRGKLIDPVLVEGGGISGHGNDDSNVPFMFLLFS